MALPELLANSPTPGVRAPLTTLGAAVLTTPAQNTQETWTFAAGPPAALAVAGQFRFVVDQEILLDITGAAGTARTVLRGQEGSTPAAHLLGSNVWHYLTAGALKAMLTTPPYVAPTLLNGWANQGAGLETAGYTKDALGFVHLKGVLGGGTSGQPAFILPPGYRSGNSGATAYPAGLAGGGSQWAVVQAYPSGNVIITWSAIGTYLGLSGITFLAEN